MKNFKWVFAALVAVAMLVGVVFKDVFATERTVPYKRVVSGGKAFLQFNTTFRARTTDTLFLAFRIDATLNPCDTTLFLLNVRSAKAHADSQFNIGVRYSFSTNGVTWSSPVTIGTDSTTWAATAGTSFSQATVRFGQVLYGGWQPFMRVTVVGLGTNKVGGKVAVDMVEQ